MESLVIVYIPDNLIPCIVYRGVAFNLDLSVTTTPVKIKIVTNRLRFGWTSNSLEQSFLTTGKLPRHLRHFSIWHF